MRERKRLTVNLRMVSPLLLGGAESGELDIPGGYAGWLRPPSLKPQLRFWFRSVAAPLVGLDIACLRETEANLWGNTDRSGPRLRALGTIPLNHGQGVEPTALLLPHAANTASMKVFWPVATQRMVSLSIEPPSDNPAFARAIAASLWLWANLGGLGKRSRRGFGSFELVSWNGSPDFETENLPITRGIEVDALRGLLHTGFLNAQAAIATAIEACGGATVHPAHASTAPTAIFHLADASQIRIGNTPWNAEPYDQPLAGPIHSIMSACHSVMGTNENQYRTHVGTAGNAGRLASPLWIRLAQLPDGETGPRVTPVATHGRGGPPPMPVANLLARINAV